LVLLDREDHRQKRTAMPRTFGIVLSLLITMPELVCASDSQEIIDWASATYHVDVVTDGIDYPLRRGSYEVGGENLSKAAASAYLPLLRRELAKYPLDLLRRTKTRRIILARNLTVDEQPRSAVPDYVTMDLFLDVEKGQHFPFYQARVIHHEFFHLIDYALHGPVLDDRDWANLNAVGFTYGPGGKFMQDRSRNAHAAARDIPGFLSLYGTSAVEEDKAELFSFLVTDGVFVKQRASDDAVVRAKLTTLKAVLRDFCPDLDRRHWERLRAHQEARYAMLAARFAITASGIMCLPTPLALPVPDYVFKGTERASSADWQR
jgi:hypothetical protein